MQSVFKEKTYNHLQVIFRGIRGKIRAGGPNLEMGYWESLLAAVACTRGQGQAP